MDMSIAISGAAAVLSLVCLVMLNGINSKLNAGAAKPAAKPAAAAHAPAAKAAPAADNGAVVAAVVAAIAAALVCMGGGEVASIRLAQKNVGWTAAAHIAGVEQF